MLAFAAIGFGLFTAPVLVNLFLEDPYGLDAAQRGLLATVGGLAGLAVLPFIGGYYDARYREDPARALRLVGLVTLPAAVFTPIQFFMPNAVLFAIAGIPQAILLTAGFTMIGPLLQSIVPVPPAGPRCVARLDLHLLPRRHRRRPAGPAPHQRLRPPHRGAGDAGPGHDHRRAPHHPQRRLHPRRPVAGGRGAARGARRARASPPRSRAPPGDPGQRPRLLLRPGAGAVRRQLRGAAGRGAGAARHQRRRQVDGAAGDRGAAHAPSAASCASTVAP